MAFTDHNGILAWTFDNDSFRMATMDETLIETFDSERPRQPFTQGDLTPSTLVNTLYGPGMVDP